MVIVYMKSQRRWGVQSFLTLVPLALLLGEVTEDLAIRFGDVIGTRPPARLPPFRSDRVMAPRACVRCSMRTELPLRSHFEAVPHLHATAPCNRAPHK